MKLKAYIPVFAILILSLALLASAIRSLIIDSASDIQTAAIMQALPDQAQPASPAAQPASNIFPAGLIAYYPFNADSKDLSGNGNDALLSGMPEIAHEGLDSASYLFHGTTDRIYRPLITGLAPSSFTVSLWVKVTSYNDVQRVGIASLFNAQVHLSTIGSKEGSFPIYVAFPSAPYNTNIGNIDGGWHQIAVSFDGSTATAYIDGVQTRTWSSSPPLGTVTDLHLGQGRVGTPTTIPYVGYLDELMLFNRVLATGEISDLYQTQKKLLPIPSPIVVATLQNIFPAGLVAYYPFDIDGKDIIGGTDRGCFWQLQHHSPADGGGAYYEWICVTGNSLTLFPRPADYQVREGAQTTISSPGPGTATFVDQGIAASSLAFDGTDEQYVSTPSISGLSTDHYTISFWFKSSGDRTTENMLYLFGDNVRLYTRITELILDVKKSDGSRTPRLSTKFTADKWHNVIVTSDGTTITEYFDGHRTSSQSLLSQLAPPVSTSLILGQASDDRDSYRGLLDELMLFNRALSQDEITGLYQSQNRILIEDSLKRPGCFVNVAIKQAGENQFPPNASQPKTVHGSYWPYVHIHESGDGASYTLRTYDSSNAFIGEYNLDDDIPGPMIAEEFNDDGSITSVPTPDEPVFPRYIVTTIPAEPTIAKLVIVHNPGTGTNNAETIINDQVRYAPCN